MNDQQPSNTPRKDAETYNAHTTFGPAPQPYNVVVCADFARQLETELSTANAEVDRLKAEAQQVELNKRALRDAVNTSDALAKVVKDLLANSKALASANRMAQTLFTFPEITITRQGTELLAHETLKALEESNIAHNKLMELFK